MQADFIDVEWLRLIMLYVAYFAIAQEFLHCDKMQQGVKWKDKRL